MVFLHPYKMVSINIFCCVIFLKYDFSISILQDSVSYDVFQELREGQHTLYFCGESTPRRVTGELHQPLRHR